MDSSSTSISHSLHSFLRRLSEKGLKATLLGFIMNAVKLVPGVKGYIDAEKQKVVDKLQSEHLFLGENKNGGHGKKFEIKPWLSKLGLAEYAPTFEKNEVDQKTLLLLTFEDLEEMGIFPIGDKRKILHEIRKLRK